MPTKVLLCDDELHILRAAEFKFQRAGYQVFCAADGEEGWEQVLADPPDIVVTDLQMPRLDGLGLAARLKGNPATSHIPVVMVSAKGFEISPQELNEQFGIRSLLPKPFSPRELVRTVEQLLAECKGELSVSASSPLPTPAPTVSSPNAACLT